MKNAVIYYSRTGHSKKIAAAIADSLGAEPLDVKENPQLDNIDLLFVVGGIYGGKCSQEIQDYLANFNGEVSKAVLVTSCLGKITPQNEVRSVLNSRNIEVEEDEFICQGSFLFLARKHPDSQDIENAISFANDMIHKYSSMFE